MHVGTTCRCIARRQPSRIQGPGQGSATSSARSRRSAPNDSPTRCSTIVAPRRHATESCGSEAVRRFAVVLQEFHGVETFQNLAGRSQDPGLDRDLRAVHGQALRDRGQVFLHADRRRPFVKPDRMIMRFLRRVLDRAVSAEEAQQLFATLRTCSAPPARRSRQARSTTPSGARNGNATSGRPTGCTRGPTPHARPARAPVRGARAGGVWAVSGPAAARRTPSPRHTRPARSRRTRRPR